jgi:hypothetical protein
MLAIATQAYDLKYFLRIWLLRCGKVVQAGRGFFGIKKNVSESIQIDSDLRRASHFRSDRSDISRIHAFPIPRSCRLRIDASVLRQPLTSRPWRKRL